MEIILRLMFAAFVAGLLLYFLDGVKWILSFIITWILFIIMFILTMIFVLISAIVEFFGGLF